MPDDDDDETEYDENDTPAEFHEYFRCTRGEHTRIYLLRPVEGGAELWRVDILPEAEPRSTMESLLTGIEEAAAFLEEVRRTLTAGGWR